MRHLGNGALAGLLVAVAGLTGCTTLYTPVTPSSPSSPTTPVACKLDTPVAAAAGYAYVCVDVTGGSPHAVLYRFLSADVNVNGTNAGKTAYTFPSGTCGHITGDGAGNIYQVALGTPATNITVYEFAANAGVLSPKRQFTATLSSEEVVPRRGQERQPLPTGEQQLPGHVQRPGQRPRHTRDDPDHAIRLHLYGDRPKQQSLRTRGQPRTGIRRRLQNSNPLQNNGRQQLHPLRRNRPRPRQPAAT